MAFNDEEQATTVEETATNEATVEATPAENTDVAQDVQQDTPATPVAPVAAPTDVIPSAFGKQQDFDYKDENGNVLRSYKFQFSTIEEGMKLAELQREGLYVYRNALIKKLVVNPEVRAAGIEWFDTHEGLWEVTNAADEFLSNMLDWVRG